MRFYLLRLMIPISLAGAGEAAAAVEQRAVSLRWNQLSEEVKGKSVTLERKDGQLVRGKVKAVEAEGVRFSSKQLIPRMEVAKLRYEKRGKMYRALLMTAIPAGLLVALAGAASASDAGSGDAGVLFGAGLGALGGGVVGGYFLGNVLDLHERVEITVIAE